MNTGNQNYTDQVPSFVKKEAYNFAEDKASFDIYNELSQIAEEIEKCRLRNC